MNEFTNDRVEVAELEGAVASDLHGAFAEWYGQSKATKGTKYLFSLSVNPDQRQRRLTRDFADRVARKLKLEGQPRAIVMHELKDKTGVPREHAHIIWSRTDTDKQKFVHLSDYKLKLRAVVREFAKDYGLELPAGVSKDGLTDRFDRKAEVAKLSEKQQEERSGLLKADRMPVVTEAWHSTQTGDEFIRALVAKDYYIARGDKRGYVIVDLAGEVHSLSRQIKGVKAPAIKQRLSALPPEKLPSVETAQAHARQMREFRQQQLERANAEEVPRGPTADDRRAVLRGDHQERRQAMEATQSKMTLRHARETGKLAILQAGINAGIDADRKQKQPTGMTGLLLRVTGVRLLVDIRRRMVDNERAKQQRLEMDALQRRHDSESRDANRARRALERVERREWKSLETAIRRDEFQKIAAPSADMEKGDGKSKGTTGPPELEAPELVPENAARRDAFNIAAKGPPPKIPPPQKRGELARGFNDKATDRKPDDLRTPPVREPEAEQQPESGLDDTPRLDFNKAASGATPEPEALQPEQTTESLADQFRRVAEKRERGLGTNDFDPGREKNYRRATPDRTVRR